MCHTTRVVVFFSVLLMGATAGLAKWMKMDEPVPVERLVKNINRYIEEHPKEAQGYYTLGRVQSLVYAGGGGAVNVVVRRRGEPEVQPEAGSLPGFVSSEADWSPGTPSSRKPPPSPPPWAPTASSPSPTPKTTATAWSRCGTGNRRHTTFCRC